MSFLPSPTSPALASAGARAFCPPYNLLSLFAGIGGFELGLERSGLCRTVAQCEIDPYCQKVLAKHWPEVKRYDDVRELTAERLAADGIRVDVICGGFPCQDISTAGRRAGMDEGTRSGLWSEVVRLTRELRPRYLFVENVANLLSGPSEKRGGWFGRVLGDLAECGYDAEWENIPAAAVGAPHRRERVWIIAHAKRDAQSWQESCHGSIGRMGRLVKSLAWNRNWQDTLATLRGMDDGFCRSVDRTDALRNAVVPQIPELLGRAVLEWEATHD